MNQSSTVKTYLLLDMSNLLYKTFFANMQEPEDICIGLCHHSALMTLNKYYRKYKADKTIMVFDDYSWRKAYTKDLSQCVTHKKYKGNRRSNLTESQKLRLAKFDAHVDEFYNMIKNNTGVVTLRRKYLEADDLVAGFLQMHNQDKHVLISADKDFMQLLGKYDLTLIDPKTDKERDLSEWNNDPNLFMFEKCIRGDTGDWVMSSYPRLHKPKIVKAYEDEYARAVIMEHKFKVLVTDPDTGNIEEVEYKTGDVFEENKYLMDLECQPDVIKDLMFECIEEAMNNCGKFNYIDFLKFCGKYELTRIVEQVDQFVPMLSGKVSR